MRVEQSENCHLWYVKDKDGAICKIAWSEERAIELFMAM